MNQLNGLRTLEVTTRERDLLLRYGSDLLDEKRLLSDSPATADGLLRVRIGARWIDNMVEDLIQASHRVRARRLLDEIEELCWVLEEALHGQVPEHGPAGNDDLMDLAPAAAAAAACVWR